MRRLLPLLLLLIAPWALAASRPLAVLGDSDSAGYQDSLNFPPGSAQRGGAYRAQSLQWTEILAQLRGEHFDLGPREETGLPGWRARLAGLWGETPRAPAKFDHRHNFAFEGAGCDRLNGGSAPQAAALAALIGSAPADWEHGVVVIRIGVNDIGSSGRIEALAANPEDADSRAAMQACVEAIDQSILSLRAVQPNLRFVLVGVFDNLHWASNLERWRDPQAVANISRGLDHFDDALRELAAVRAPAAFVSDRDWFAGHWGGRDAQGLPAYRSVAIGDLRVRNALGDSPEHACLADGHGGTAWNALWANALIEQLNRLDPELAVPALSEAEILSLLPRR